jgi:glycosyltransferase involved in cell wall biosynthesis
MTVPDDTAAGLRPPTCHGRWMDEACEPGLASVIMPTYNRASLLLSAMDSVRAQTYRPIELVVVDDGSTDDTQEVLARWGRRHADGPLALRCLRQENRGAPAARNLGLIESRGEFLLFLDSDDLLGRTKLAASIALLRSAGRRAVAYGPWRCLYWGPIAGYGPLQQPKVFASERERIATQIMGYLGVPVTSYVFPRAVARAIGPWDERLRQRQDADYIVRAALTGCAFLPEHSSVVHYRRHGLQHIGHRANFRRHFPSRLALADKWYGFLQHGILPSEAGPALRWNMAHLLMEAHIARHAAGVVRCRRRLHGWFGDDAADLPDSRPAFAAQVCVKRTLIRPLRGMAGELPSVYVGLLLQRCKDLLQRWRTGRGPQAHA